MAGYIYVPGLAREELINAPAADYDAFRTRVRDAFGHLEKWETEYQRTCRPRPDEFLTEAVATLHTQLGAEPVDCGHALRWVPGLVRGKAAELLGQFHHNVLAREGAQQPRRMARVVARTPWTPPCNAGERMAFVPPGTITRAPRIWRREEEDAWHAAAEQRRAAEGVLGGLTADDVLYIVGHGNPLGNALTFKVPAPHNHDIAGPPRDGVVPRGCERREHQERWHVDAPALAALLYAEGLSLTHRRIDMVMCFGGGVSIANEQTVQPFAERLARALALHGYDEIEVSGAVGLMIGSLGVRPRVASRGDGDDRALEVDIRFTIPRGAPDHAEQFRTFTPRLRRPNDGPHPHPPRR